jgi:hypothetical protein
MLVEFLRAPFVAQKLCRWLLRQAFSLELFAYVMTRDEAEFRRVREDLLMHIGEIIENSGSGFAMPAQLLYIGAQGQSHPERTSVPEILPKRAS